MLLPFPFIQRRLSAFCRFAVAHRALPVFALAALIASAPAALSQERIDRPLSQRQPVIVGATSDSFPYGYVNTKGEWTGFAVDLFDAVARVTNLSIRREVDAGIGLHARFRRGEFDLLQAYSQTPERDAFADFSVPYLTLQGCIFVRKDDPTLRRVEDLNEKNFAIIGERSIGEKFIRDRNLRVRPIYVGSSEEGLRLVDEGRCSAVFVSYLTALSVIERAKLKNVAIFGEPLADYDIRHCFAVHKGDSQLLARLNEGLAILNRTGEYRRIYNKWFGRFESPVFTREQVIAYVAAAMALALLATTWGLLRQRALRRRIAGQAAELLEKEGLLQALYDNVPLAMTVIEQSPDGPRVLIANRQSEALFGVSAAAAAGELVDRVALEPEWKSHLLDVLRRWPQGSELVREEHQLNSTRKHLVVTLVPLAASSTGALRMCVLAEDVTRRRELDEEISQSRKLRAVGELVGGIAHEFNNLLTPVMLQIGEIQLDWAGDKRLQSSVDVISRAMQRAAELTRRLLTFGRRAERRSEPVYLRNVANSCLELLRQTVDRRIVLEAQLPEDLSPLFFNITDLHQALLNLLLNARDTLTEKIAISSDPAWKPTIRVEAAQLPADAVIPSRVKNHPPLIAWQRLTVHDNGMGMSSEVKERIFEPFYTTKEVGRGTGLGLATVWHVVVDSGGRLEVESAPGLGSAFHIYLPVWSGTERPSPSMAGQPTEAAPAPRPLRIFLADDEDLVVRTVTAGLKRAGHEITHRADGQASWDFLREHLGEFDLLIFDVNMPGIDGIELTRRIRKILHYRGKVMIISGRLTSNDLNALTEASVDAVLPKPFTMEQLLGMVHSTCDLTDEQRALSRA